MSTHGVTRAAGEPDRDVSDSADSFTSRLAIRVRYHECDPMGFVHHAVYPVWFEMGRTELLRERGMNYRDLEEAGLYVAVVALDVRYKKPARYDDVLTLITSLRGTSRVKIQHAYELYRDRELLTAASTTLACLDRSGRARPIPEALVPLMVRDEREPEGGSA